MRAVRGPATALAAAVLAAAVSVLGGCGQKGPLYLPEKGGAVVTAPAGSPPPAPAPQPQSTHEPPPAETVAPPKKPDKDQEQPDPQ